MTLASRPAETVLVALPRPAVPLSHVRGTVLVNAHRVLLERRLDDAYWSHVSPRHRDAIRQVAPLSWVPLAHASAHYAAMSALITSRDELIAIGRDASRRLQDGYLATLSRARSGSSVLAPEEALSLFPKLHARNLQGGAIAIYGVGAGAARIEYREMPLFQHDYFRICMLGWVLGGLDRTTASVSVRELPDAHRNDRLTVLASWS